MVHIVWALHHQMISVIKILEFRFLTLGVIFMRKFFLVLVFFIIANPALSQNSSLFIGGWKLNGKDRSITLVNPPFSESKVFFLSCVSLDRRDARFSIRDESRQIIAELIEGGSAIVEGRTIHIRQTAEGEAAFCTWNILEESETFKEEATWVGFPNGRQVLLAAFQENRRFVFTLNKSTGCTDESANLIVDGNVVKDIDNNKLTIFEGVSFIGQGKIISAILNGTCDPNMNLSGTLSIPRIEPKK